MVILYNFSILLEFAKKLQTYDLEKRLLQSTPKARRGF